MAVPCLAGGPCDLEVALAAAGTPRLQAYVLDKAIMVLLADQADQEVSEEVDSAVGASVAASQEAAEEGSGAEVEASVIVEVSAIVEALGIAEATGVVTTAEEALDTAPVLHQMVRLLVREEAAAAVALATEEATDEEEVSVGMEGAVVGMVVEVGMKVDDDPTTTALAATQLLWPNGRTATATATGTVATATGTGIAMVTMIDTPTSVGTKVITTATGKRDDTKHPTSPIPQNPWSPEGKAHTGDSTCHVAHLDWYAHQRQAVSWIASNTSHTHPETTACMALDCDLMHTPSCWLYLPRAQSSLDNKPDAWFPFPVECHWHSL